MPLEQFKTQVLLLHSEQSALDKLSAGFDDNYTVHCATTGFEALNTLGETPIHVIVSANALPGMSGAEALREAKKRSPETVGILVTGNDDSHEVLAGDKEIFQIIRGGIDPKDITKLIEAATQQMRLMAMADSANDQAADIDEGTAEHIVMETDDHGSTIISDGTGQHAILGASKLSESTPVGAQAVGILLMTKDEQFLESIKECCRGMHSVHTASTIKQAQELIQGNKVGVSIVDAAMVGPNVEKLTSHLQSLQKRLVTIVAGRREDGDMLMDLINRGKVYRFLLKPVSPGRVRLAVDASVRHHLDSPESAFKKTDAQTNKAPEPPKAKAPPEPPKAKQPPKKADLPPANVITDGLANAFDEDDSRFAETVSGILTGIGRSQKKEPEPPAAAMDLDATDGLSAGSPLVKIGIAAAVLVVAGLGFWMMSGNDDASEATPAQQPVVQDSAQSAEPAATRPRPAPATAASPEAAPVTTRAVEDATADPAVSRDSGLAALLTSAREAMATDRIFTPVDDNALELYSQALLVAPKDPDVVAGFEQSMNAAITAIETALLEGRLTVVEAGIRQVGLVQPDHPRLPFLIAQANQAKARLALDDARDAIRDGRLDAAAAAIEDAREAGVDAGTLESLDAELESARSSQEVAQILDVASRRLSQGRLLSPSRDNARYLFELVLKNEPDNVAARQGLSAVAAKLALNARAEMDAGRFDQAESLLRQAAQIDANSPEVAASRRALSDARDAVQQQAADQAEQERLAAEREARLAAEAAAEAAKPVPVSSLTRVKYVSPKYPRAAERRGISGWVDVLFTVSVDGTVRDVEVRDSLPGEIFVSAAVAAVERWEFEPVRENGDVVEKRAGVRLMFALE